MSTAGNLIVALDLLDAYLAAQARIAKLIRTARDEDRDVTDEELADLRAQSRALEDSILND